MDDVNIVLSPYTSLKDNERMLFEELTSYQHEMFEEGRMTLYLDLLYELEEVLSSKKNIIEIENFKTQPNQVVFNARSIDGVTASTEEDILKYLRSFSHNSKILIVLDNEHLLHKISELCLSHQIKVQDFKKQGYLSQGAAILTADTVEAPTSRVYYVGTTPEAADFIDKLYNNTHR